MGSSDGVAPGVRAFLLGVSLFGSHTTWLKQPSVSLGAIGACVVWQRLTRGLTRLRTCPRCWNRWACVCPLKHPTAMKPCVVGEGSTAAAVVLLLA